MIRVGIIGGAGYTAGELLRILIGHPQVEIASYIAKVKMAGWFMRSTAD
jgi:N-acetyl-gamma-glutamyl-phosphate reductase